MNLNNPFEKIKQGIGGVQHDKLIIEFACGLMVECGISYQSIFGEKITGEFDGKPFSIQREGMPIDAITELNEYITHRNAKMKSKKGV